ncbi:hypothetical protein L5515_003375 [Caenorhabditis briggsae]|uniref:Uncharacterized protein n=1 Tax=Caenorhabditis briggsae TaxID=6238 RepID=A0AAE9JBF5_CAEBR|nr:hypothetical protein L5515_003375 [Caenorhabditis briggsae]
MLSFFVDTEPVEQQVEGESSSKLNMNSNIVTTVPNVPKSTASDNDSHSETAGNGPSSSSQGIICTSAASTLHLAPKASPRTSFLNNVESRGTTTNSNEEPEMAPNPLPRKTASILNNVGSRGATPSLDIISFCAHLSTERSHNSQTLFCIRYRPLLIKKWALGLLTLLFLASALVFSRPIDPKITAEKRTRCTKRMLRSERKPDLTRLDKDYFSRIFFK